jgi:hypothetical protein
LMLYGTIITLASDMTSQERYIALSRYEVLPQVLEMIS